MFIKPPRSLFKIGDEVITTEDIRAVINYRWPMSELFKKAFKNAVKRDPVLKSPENPNGMTASKLARYLARRNKNAN